MRHGVSPLLSQVVCHDATPMTSAWLHTLPRCMASVTASHGVLCTHAFAAGWPHAGVLLPVVRYASPRQAHCPRSAQGHDMGMRARLAGLTIGPPTDREKQAAQTEVGIMCTALGGDARSRPLCTMPLAGWMPCDKEQLAVKVPWHQLSAADNCQCTDAEPTHARPTCVGSSTCATATQHHQDNPCMGCVHVTRHAACTAQGNGHGHTYISRVVATPS